MRILRRENDPRHILCARNERPVAASGATMGRPKIEGMAPFNLRILQEHKDALGRICEAERVKRGDPALTVTDLIREYIAAGIVAHDTKGRRK